MWCGDGYSSSKGKAQLIVVIDIINVVVDVVALCDGDRVP